MVQFRVKLRSRLGSRQAQIRLHSSSPAQSEPYVSKNRKCREKINRCLEPPEGARVSCLRPHQQTPYAPPRGERCGRVQGAPSLGAPCFLPLQAGRFDGLV